MTTISDRIDTSSRFNGGQIGIRGNWRWDRFTARGTATVAFGASDEGDSLSGLTTIVSSAGVPVTLPGGFFVPSNVTGTHTEEFAVVPRASPDAWLPGV